MAPAPSPRRARHRGRARSLSDAEASMVDEDTAMGDMDDGVDAGATSAAGEGEADTSRAGVRAGDGFKATDEVSII